MQQDNTVAIRTNRVWGPKGLLSRSAKRRSTFLLQHCQYLMDGMEQNKTGLLSNLLSDIDGMKIEAEKPQGVCGFVFLEYIVWPYKLEIASKIQPLRGLILQGSYEMLSTLNYHKAFLC